MNRIEKLVPVREEDFDRMIAFYQDAIENTKDMERYGKWIFGLHPTEEMIREYIRKGNMYDCEEGGVLLGAMAITWEQGEDYHDTDWAVSFQDDEVVVVHLLCVNPAVQKQGVEKQMMKCAIALFKEKGKKALRLDALSCNSPAQRLYESIGFVRRGTKRWYADNVGWTDFFLYEFMLASEIGKQSEGGTK